MKIKKGRYKDKASEVNIHSQQKITYLGTSNNDQRLNVFNGIWVIRDIETKVFSTLNLYASTWNHKTVIIKVPK